MSVVFYKTLSDGCRAARFSLFRDGDHPGDGDLTEARRLFQSVGGGATVSDAALVLGAVSP